MNKAAIVTGGASGLGFQFVKLLVEGGYHVYSVDIEHTFEKNIQELENLVTWIIKDLSVQGAAQEIFDEIGDKPVEVLINNAGFGTFGKFHELEWSRQQAMINLHVMTTAHLTHLFIPKMIERGIGRIMNVASLAAYQPGPLMSQYYATKSYIMSFTEAIANELRDTRVTATVLCPGQTQTNFQETVSTSSRETQISFNIAKAEDVARFGYKAMMEGKINVIHGNFNKFLAFLNRILSRKIATNIVRNLQEKNRK